MKKSKWMPLALTAAAIALLGGGYLALEHADQAEEPVQTVTVSTVTGELDAIEYTGDAGTVSLVKSDGVWQWAEDSEFPLMQEYPQTMASRAQPIEATALVRSDRKNLEDYGLDDPAQTIVLQSGEETVTCCIGDQNSYTGEYYMMLEGGQEVYTVPASFPEAFGYSLYDMIELEEWPVNSLGQVRSVERVDSEGAVLLLTAEETEDGALSYQVNGEEADTTAAQEYVRNLTDLSVSRCAAYKADEDQRSTYGLDVPAAVFCISCTDAETGSTWETTLTVGASDGNGGRYVCIGDSQAVNVMDGETLESLLSAAASDFTPEVQEDGAETE